ncbi:MAG: hypothetical protein IKF82_01285 [Bacilli bacterium]|nr:hypothetical protein [Bacilli bacterium]
MPFLNNNKFKEIRTAANNGDEKALMVLQALRKGSQEDVDRLVGDYYSIPEQSMNDVPVQTELAENPMENTADAVTETIQAGDVNPGSERAVPQVEDLTGVLDGETEGLFDENEIPNLSFSDFLGNKRRDGLRGKKNAEYFKAFNPESLSNYVNAKKESYKNKFGDSIHDIEHQFDDYNKSVDLYSQKINDVLDDDLEIDMDVTGQAYNDIMDNNGIMHSFGRFWDDKDTDHIVEDLKILVSKYGKKNVLAALNVLKTDVDNYKNYRLGQINEEVERYNKSLDKILK